MSLVDDLLIIIDDKPGITRDEIFAIAEEPAKQKPAVLSALARLQARRFVTERALGYHLTQVGHERIDLALNALSEFKQNPKQWFLILIEINEKEKLLREKLRYELRKIGVGSIKKGVFVSFRASSKPVEEVLERLHLANQALLLKLETIPVPIAAKIAQKTWDWQELNSSYAEFIGLGQDLLRKLRSLPQEIQRTEAKKAVFQFAKLLTRDPQISDQLAPAHYLRKQAIALYQQLQPHCYR